MKDGNRKDAKDAKGKMDIEEIGKKIIGAAIKAHCALCPGLLESAYRKCLDCELRKTGLKVECEIFLPIKYEDVKIDAGYRIDILVDNCVIIENKAVENITYTRSPAFDLSENEKL